MSGEAGEAQNKKLQGLIVECDHCGREFEPVDERVKVMRFDGVGPAFVHADSCEGDYERVTDADQPRPLHPRATARLALGTRPVGPSAQGRCSSIA